MKIRTITTGLNLRAPVTSGQLQRSAAAALRLRREFESAGYEVQTVRLATQPWERYCHDPGGLADMAVFLEKTLEGMGIDYFSLGPTSRAAHIPDLYEAIRRTRKAFCTVSSGGKKGPNRENCRGAAALVKRLAGVDGDGFANLRFAACFNIPPGTPFFPAAYHKGPPSFSLGLENSDLVYEAFAEAGDYSRAGECLKKVMSRECRRVERIALRAAEESGLAYGGLDVSVAPSVKRQHSVAFAFEKLDLGRFGQSGTLAVARTITQVLKSLPVKLCGYSGLMLPVLEDFGLARRNRQQAFDVAHLLSYSAVCGTGLDTIPLAGDVSLKRLYALLLDIGTLAAALDKPLSARLMPIPGKKVGEETTFDFPYFANTTTMAV